jgi:hypothetical protein
MEDQLGSGLEVENHPLPPSANALNAPPFENPRKRFRLTVDHVTARQEYATEGGSGESTVQLTGDGLSLWKFRHFRYPISTNGRCSPIYQVIVDVEKVPASRHVTG